MKRLHCIAPLFVILALLHALKAEQLLQLQNCTQSSLAGFTPIGYCTKALDGNMNQSYYTSGSCTHTNNELSWWEARTTSAALFATIRIYNRQDCCAERLNNFTITVDEAECARVTLSSPFAIQNFACGLVGQTLRISLSEPNFLTLCEVQAFGDYVTYPQLQLQNCSQSSNFRPDGLCVKAIDGNPNPQYFDGFCTHTNNELGWWQAVAPRVARFVTIRIFNRQDCCTDRLRRFRITVDDVECARYTQDVNFLVKDFACGRIGQVLRISQLEPNFLSLCEVQVFGEYMQQEPLTPTELQPELAGHVQPLSNCSKALDGSTNRVYSSGSCTHTTNEMGWWEASTQTPARFTTVRIYNRQDCCAERLNNFRILVDGVECHRVVLTVPFAVENYTCGLVGRTLRISQLQANYLTLCEVQAFGQYQPQQLRLSSCSQSSTAYSGFCIRGIDNGTSQSYGVGSCTHTQNELGWWQAQTDGPAFISFVRIYNRQDCCSERLNNFYITVDGVECASYTSSSSFSVKMFECNRVGQVIRINNRMQSYLTLCEVQVLGRLLAAEELGSQLYPDTCSQSSTYLTGVCSRAIDNSTNQAYNGGSCTHTELEQGWWQAELAAPARINAIRIYNRQDCCPYRLNNFAITVDGVECASFQSEEPFSVKLFMCGRAGQVVRINNRMQSHVTLCEVQLFGQSLTDQELGELLPLSNCSQSSTVLSGVCSRAIDRNSNRDYSGGSCTHTQNEFGWWQAETERPAFISYVRIYNRKDCCPERLNNFTVTVNGIECATYESASFFGVRVFQCNRAGLVLRVNNRQQSFLTLCEVEVFGRYLTVVEYGQQLPLSSCAQSSTFQSAVCIRAIDGNINQLYNGGSCSHTQSEVSWWQAQTTRQALITYVRIYNRQDCCPQRLNNFSVSVNGVECASYESGAYFLVKTFLCNRIGQIVRISSRVQSFLTLCEVQIFGQYHDDKLQLFDCAQSSIYLNGVCIRAIDNNQNQAWVGNSCTHTNAVAGSWWEARVSGGRATISRVRIYNRQDCCSNRLNSFYITVDNVFCASYNSNEAFLVKDFTCNAVGQVVRITSTLQEPLTLCEVEVYGSIARRRNRRTGTIGCYADNSNWRDLPVRATITPQDQLTPTLCNALCYQLQASYYGLQGGNECWCGEDYGQYGQSYITNCNLPCAGDSSQACGGALFNLVFAVTPV